MSDVNATNRIFISVKKRRNMYVFTKTDAEQQFKKNYLRTQVDYFFNTVTYLQTHTESKKNIQMLKK